jgi:uncharacterized protein
LAGDEEGYIVFDAAPEELEEDEYILAKGAEGEVDIAPLLYSAMVVAVPPIILCKEDCKGLCPHCGANLNLGPCGCDDDVSDDSPFAVLKDLL